MAQRIVPRDTYIDPERGEIVDVATGIVLEDRLPNSSSGFDKDVRHRQATAPQLPAFGLGTDRWLAGKIIPHRIRTQFRRLDSFATMHGLHPKLVDLMRHGLRKMVRQPTPIRQHILYALWFVNSGMTKQEFITARRFTVGRTQRFNDALPIVRDVLKLPTPSEPTGYAGLSTVKYTERLRLYNKRYHRHNIEKRRHASRMHYANNKGYYAEYRHYAIAKKRASLWAEHVAISDVLESI